MRSFGEKENVNQTKSISGVSLCLLPFGVVLHKNVYYVYFAKLSAVFPRQRQLRNAFKIQMKMRIYA